MSMETICVRLTRGTDLKEEIKRLAGERHISCGTVLCGVGCISRARLRCADGKTVITIDEPCEIVSLIGTVSETRCHLHATFAKADLSVIGGHLMEGCIVNTTCELIIGYIDDTAIVSRFDESTGYVELEFIKES